MAAATDEIALEIRKLRKKLRQIENLERSNRELSEEEEIKVGKKIEIRETLLEILAEQGEVNPVYHPDTTVESEASSSFTASDFSQVRTSEDPDTAAPTEPVLETDNSEKHTEESLSSSEAQKTSRPSPVSKRKVINSTEHKKEQLESDSLPESKKAKKDTTKSSPNPLNAERKRWRLAEFRVDFLEGHSDLITAVDTDGVLLVSASRDTTVKVWNLKSCQEVRNLGGHTNIVTAVQLLSARHSQALSESLEDVSPGDQLVISGCLDCSLRLWSTSTGQTVKRIYTFDPITKLQYVPQLQVMFTGSDGGKISMWDLSSGEATHSICAHQGSITGLKFSEGCVYSASEDGTIKVHEVREQSLSCVFVSENVHKADGSQLTLRRIHDIDVRDSKVFYGDDRENLKILDWKTGTVSKLRNNISEFGWTDAVCASGDILLTSGYDLDNGLAFLNVRSFLQGGEYLASLSDDDTGRVLCLRCHEGSDKLVVIVSGGVDLKVWRMAQRLGVDDDLVPTRYLTRLSHNAIDSDQDSDLDLLDSDDEGGGGGTGRGTKRLSLGSLGNVGQSSSWTSWCVLV